MYLSLKGERTRKFIVKDALCMLLFIKKHFGINNSMTETNEIEELIVYYHMK